MVVYKNEHLMVGANGCSVDARVEYEYDADTETFTVYGMIIGRTTFDHVTVFQGFKVDEIPTEAETLSVCEDFMEGAAAVIVLNPDTYRFYLTIVEIAEEHGDESYDEIVLAVNKEAENDKMMGMFSKN